MRKSGAPFDVRNRYYSTEYALRQGAHRRQLRDVRSSVDTSKPRSFGALRPGRRKHDAGAGVWVAGADGGVGVRKARSAACDVAAASSCLTSTRMRLLLSGAGDAERERQINRENQRLLDSILDIYEHPVRCPASGLEAPGCTVRTRAVPLRTRL